VRVLLLRASATHAPAKQSACSSVRTPLLSGPVPLFGYWSKMPVICWMW
jgi:hypothetical protein